MVEKNPQNLEQEIPLTKTEKRKKILFLLVLLIGFNVLVFGGLYKILSKNKSTETVNSKSSIVSLSPTPFPFQEMTIPYLKSRDYSSKLGPLEKISENEKYTSYLTSYDSDGYKINGLLTVPKVSESEKKLGGFPGIIFVHGYIPPSTYTTTGNYVDYVDYLARNGFVVFKIDLRGHGQSEGEPGGAYYSSDYVIDTLNAREALQNSDFINLPNNVGLWGHSMAGNVVSRALAVRPDIPATVIWAGAVYTYSDMQEYGISDNSYRPPVDASRVRQKRNEMIAKYGQFDPKNSFWKQVPFTNYLSDIKGAISINHAQDDNVVDIGYSISLNSILNKTQIPHEFNEYTSGGHNITGSNFNTAMANTVKFYNKYLK